MHIVEGWVFRVHAKDPTGRVGIYLKGPSATGKQLWASFFLEVERLFPTRKEAVRAMRSFPPMSHVVKPDVRHIRLEIADDPNEWVPPFTQATSYVVLWYFRHQTDETRMVMERPMGTRNHMADDDLTGVVGHIPGADFYQNGNVPFEDFSLAKDHAYEASRQAEPTKIAIITMRGA